MWFRGPVAGDPKAKRNTLLKKYIAFCVDTSRPMLPADILQFCRYIRWLPLNGIDGGWDSARQYTGALAQFLTSINHPDPRETEKAAWDVLRIRYLQNVQVVRVHSVKLAVQPAHLQALAIEAILLDTDEATADMFCDAMMEFTAVRVGHVSPKKKDWMPHVLTWDRLYFHPNVDNCTAVFYHVPTTKTRRGTELRPFWTCHGRVTSNPTICPTEWAVRHWRRNFRPGVTSPASPVFTNPTTGGPLLRSAYTKRLRARLLLAVDRHLTIPGFDIRHYSGISFRRSGITQLSYQAAMHNLNMDAVADFADHRDIKTTRGYNEATLESRSGYTGMIGSNFTPLSTIMGMSGATS